MSNKATISYELMLRVVQMIQTRGYKNIVFYVHPMLEEEEEAPKRSRGKGKKKEKEERDMNPQIFSIEYMDDEGTYAELEERFLDSHVMIGEEAEEEEGEDTASEPSKLILLYPTAGTGLPEVRLAITRTFNLRRADVIVDLTIIITEERLSTPALKELSKPSEYRFQQFTQDEIHIPESILLSKYEVLSDEETEELFVALDVRNGKNFPKALTGDPAIKYYGFTPRTILRVIRDSVGLPTVAETSICYQIVTVGNPVYKRKDKKDFDFFGE